MDLRSATNLGVLLSAEGTDDELGCLDIIVVIMQIACERLCDPEGVECSN